MQMRGLTRSMANTLRSRRVVCGLAGVPVGQTTGKYRHAATRWIRPDLTISTFELDDGVTGRRRAAVVARRRVAVEAGVAGAVPIRICDTVSEGGASQSGSAIAITTVAPAAAITQAAAVTEAAAPPSYPEAHTANTDTRPETET